MQTAYDDVIAALRIYHDIPAMIAEEWETIRNCEAQREKIGESAVSFRDMVRENGGGDHSDKTADLALKDDLFQAEINDRLSHIDELRRKREWLRAALTKISRKDKYILELAYMGPQDPQQRTGWRGKRWNEIAHATQFSSRTVRRRAYEMLKQIKEEK